MVYKVKEDTSDEFEKCKARLVRSYRQRYGVDFEETFTSVVRHSVIRLLFSIGNKTDMAMNHLDVTAVFSNDEIEEEIFMEQGEGYEVGGSASQEKYLRFKRSKQGLESQDEQSVDKYGLYAVKMRTLRIREEE